MVSTIDNPTSFVAYLPEQSPTPEPNPNAPADGLIEDYYALAEAGLSAAPAPTPAVTESNTRSNICLGTTGVVSIFGGLIAIAGAIGMHDLSNATAAGLVISGIASTVGGSLCICSLLQRMN